MGGPLPGDDVDVQDRYTDNFTVAPGHPCLAGHFPGNPVVPGVLLLDHVLAIAEAWRAAPLGALTLPQVKFVQPLLPGQQADVELVATASGFAFSVHHAGQLLARGSVGVGA